MKSLPIECCAFLHYALFRPGSDGEAHACNINRRSARRVQRSAEYSNGDVAVTERTPCSNVTTRGVCRVAEGRQLLPLRVWNYGRTRDRCSVMPCGAGSGGHDCYDQPGWFHTIG